MSLGQCLICSKHSLSVGYGHSSTLTFASITQDRSYRNRLAQTYVCAFALHLPCLTHLQIPTHRLQQTVNSASLRNLFDYPPFPNKTPLFFGLRVTFVSLLLQTSHSVLGFGCLTTAPYWLGIIHEKGSCLHHGQILPSPSPALP